MRLSRLLASQVSTNCRAKGTKYFAEGAVKRIERRDGIIQARVSGTENYDVWIEADGGAIGASRTCPFFIDQLEICKHVWAVILTAEKRGIPLIEPGPASRPDEISLEPMDPDNPVDLGHPDEDDTWMEDDDDWLPEPVRPRAAAARRRTPPHGVSSSTTSWQHPPCPQLARARACVKDNCSTSSTSPRRSPRPRSSWS